MGAIEELLGRQVGRYHVVSHLASGGMAELYIARQEAMGGFEKEVVVKVLQPRYAENPRVVAMFLDEARLAAKLNHQSIVHVYDVADDGGLKYIAMEYIRGETLTDIVRRGLAAQKFLPLEHAVHIVRQTAAGLAYAHAFREPDGHVLRIVHRDVSPTNILVTMEGQTKIVDFGIARVQDELREESGIRPGKASYMSPEQVAGEGVDYRSDIFSLGIILYELTLGQRLFRGPAEIVMKRIAEDKVPPPTAVRRDFPPPLELIVMRALEKRPADRYQSAEEMRVDLEEFLADEGLRTGSRRMALYMKEIFPSEVTPDAAPGGGEGGVPLEVRVRDDSEELNFDRRAPISLRFEAAPPEEERRATRRRAPIPEEEGLASARLTPARPLAAAPERAGPGTKTNGVGGGPTLAPVLPPRAPPGAIPEAIPGAIPGATGADLRAPRSAATSSAGVGDEPVKPPKSKLGWVILVLLVAGAAVLAFVGAR
jgi:serine/threonine protein kinase